MSLAPGRGRRGSRRPGRLPGPQIWDLLPRARAACRARQPHRHITPAPGPPRQGRPTYTVSPQGRRKGFTLPPSCPPRRQAGPGGRFFDRCPRPSRQTWRRPPRGGLLCTRARQRPARLRRTSSRQTRCPWRAACRPGTVWIAPMPGDQAPFSWPVGAFCICCQGQCESSCPLLALRAAPGSQQESPSRTRRSWLPWRAFRACASPGQRLQTSRRR